MSQRNVETYLRALDAWNRGALEEWRCPTLPRERAWHLGARRSDDLPATAALLVDHLTTQAPALAWDDSRRTKEEPD